MRIYRIENKNTRCGPYNGYGRFAAFSDIIRKAHSYQCNEDGIDYHPSGMVDIGTWSRKYFFGFESPKKLKSWFDKFLVDLKKNDYAIFIYDIPSCFVKMGKSGFQLGFLKKKANLVTIMEISNDN